MNPLPSLILDPDAVRPIPTAGHVSTVHISSSLIRLSTGGHEWERAVLDGFLAFLAESTPCVPARTVPWAYRGRPQVRHQGVLMPAARLAYLQHHGPIPVDHLVHHHCQNPECISGHHLQAMTWSDHGRLHGILRRWGAQAA